LIAMLLIKPEPSPTCPVRRELHCLSKQAVTG
jgi:hypothetical protein